MAYKKVIYLGLDYSEFEKGIRNSNQELKRLDDEFKNTMVTAGKIISSNEKFAMQEEHLNDMFEAQKQLVHDAEIALIGLRNSQDATEAKVEAAEKSLNKQRITLMKLQDAMRQMAFTEGLDECNEKLVKLDMEYEHSKSIISLYQSETDKLEQKQTYLAKKYELQAEKVEVYRKEYERLKEEYGDSEYVQNVQDTLLKEEISLNNLKNSLEELGNLDFTKNIASADERLEQLNNEFELTEATLSSYGTATDKLRRKHEHLLEQFNIQKEKVEEYRKEYERLKEEYGDSEYVQNVKKALMQEQVELKNLQNELEETRIKVAGVKESMTALGIVLTSLATLYLNASKSVADYANNVITLSNETHIAMETLQEWEYAFDSINVSMDTVTDSIKNMINNMQTATTGSNEVSKAFTKLGVKVTDTHGKMRNSEEVFYDVIDALGKVKNETERDQLAMDIFGESATELAGIIDIGSDGLKEYGDRAHELGLIMSDEAMETAGEYHKALEDLNKAFEAMKNNLGMYLIPILTDFVNAIAGIPAPVLSSIVIILSIVATITSLVKAINAVRATGSTLKTFYNMITKGLDNTYIKIAAVAAIITTLIGLIVVLTGKGKDAINLIESLGSFGGINAAGITGRSPRYNARGTHSFAGGATWVGEEGPELVNLPPGTRIYNNRESRQIAGGNTYYINMNMDITKLKTVNDVVEAVTGLANSSGSGGIIHV